MIETLSIKQINASFCEFLELGGTAELFQYFLRGTEAFQLFRGDFFEIITEKNQKI